MKIIRLFTLCLVSLTFVGLAFAQDELYPQENRAQRFERLDRDHDGVLTREEAGNATWFKRALRRSDRNSDGQLQRNEVLVQERVDDANGLTKPDEPPLTPHLNLRYDQIEGVNPDLLSLDLYVPMDNPTKRPVLIMIHGGGWRHGDKAGAPIIGAKRAHFVANGYIFASINYRLSADQPGPRSIQHPVHARDCAKAIAWIHNHISEYGGDPNQLHLMGHSAGGHLAAIMATNERFLKAEGKDLSILKSNVLLDPAALDLPRYVALSNGRGMTGLYDQIFGTDKANHLDASPQQHVGLGKKIPPTLIFYAGPRMRLDVLAPDFAKSLTAAGSPSQAVDTVTLEHDEINTHIGMIGDPMTSLIMRLHAGENPTSFPTTVKPTEPLPANPNGSTAPSTSTNAVFALAYTHPYRLGQASALVDAYGTGRLDIAVASKRHIHLIRNTPRGFAHAGSESVDNANGWGLHDFNGDGRMDLFVAQGGVSDSKDARINKGNGTFDPVNLGNETKGHTRNVLFADFNGDGWIDSYHSVSAFGTNHFGNELHMGKPDGTFWPDIIESVLTPPITDFWYKQSDGPDGCVGKWANKMFKGAIVRDLDNDGKPDIVTGAYADLGYQDPRNLDYGRQWVERQDRGIFIFQNKSTSNHVAFTEVAKTAIGPKAFGNTASDWNPYAIVPMDFDRDGDMDLFVGAVLRHQRNREWEDTRAVAFYENISKPGQIQFRDITGPSGFGRFNDIPVAERGQRNFASGAPIDFDNDGWVDLVLVNRRDMDGTPYPYPHLFRNNGDGTFTEVPPAKHGLATGGGGRDLVYGDLNNDGRLDLVVNDGTAGGYDGADNSRIYLNQLQTANHWIQIKVARNKQGSPMIGAKVLVYAAVTKTLLGADELRTDFCYRSKRAPILHFGLGTADKADIVIVTPDGKTTRYPNLATDQQHTFTPVAP